jgi:hypothetical protein
MHKLAIDRPPLGRQFASKFHGQFDASLIILRRCHRQPPRLVVLSCLFLYGPSQFGQEIAR